MSVLEWSSFTFSYSLFYSPPPSYVLSQIAGQTRTVTSLHIDQASGGSSFRVDKAFTWTSSHSSFRSHVPYILYRYPVIEVSLRYKELVFLCIEWFTRAIVPQSFAFHCAFCLAPGSSLTFPLTHTHPHTSPTHIHLHPSLTHIRCMRLRRGTKASATVN